MRKAFALLWLALVLAALAHVGVSAWRGLKLESDIMALLPREDFDPALQRAKDGMAKSLARRVVVLVGHEDRAQARDFAGALRARLLERGLVTPATDIPGDQAIRALGAAYFPHRAGLLSDGDREALARGQGDQLVTRALAQIYGVGGVADSRLLARDPFLLFPAFLTGLPGGGNRLALDDGFLSVTETGTTWVMLSLTLAGEAYELDFQKRFMAAFHEMPPPAGMRVLRLGAIFFAQAGADQALAESSRIGGISMAGVVVLALLAFRSAGPLLLAITAISVGLACALSACLMLFGSIHVAAQLFGASLIGIAVDYSLLYFGQIFSTRAEPARRLAHVLPGMALAMGSAVIGFASLGVAPFPGFRQVALFSGVGLVASFLTVVLWFPLLDRSRNRPLPRGAERAMALLSAGRLRLALLAVIVVAAAFGAVHLKADDDVRRQQSLSPSLLAEQAEIQRLVGFGQSGQFFVIRGESEQQVLEREEELAQALAGQAGWQSVARFLPSQRRQAENAALVGRELAPRLDEYRATLGMPALSPEPPPARPLTLADLRATGALPFLDMLVLGDDLHVVSLNSGVDLELLRRIAIPGVQLVDPAADYSLLLETYRHRALGLLALAAVLMAPLLVWRHGWRRGLAVLAPALGAIALTPPLVALAGVEFSFFAAMALVLVLAMGVDYAVFCAEDTTRDPVTLFSVFLAMSTTLLSFGLLAFSGMAAIRAFGATMLVGVLVAFLLASAMSMGGLRRAKSAMSK